MAKFIRSRFARAVLLRLQGAMTRPHNIDERQGQVPPCGIAPAAARGSIAHVLLTGGFDDPLLGMYGQILNMGKGGADGDIYRGVAESGPSQGQMHALKYRKPEDDPMREIETL